MGLYTKIAQVIGLVIAQKVGTRQWKSKKLDCGDDLDKWFGIFTPKIGVKFYTLSANGGKKPTK